ncbi:MAG: hypothetical protein QM564_05630 [Bergeyella sp.]
MKKTIDLINNKEILTDNVVVVLYQSSLKSNDVGVCPQFFSHIKNLFLAQKMWTVESINYLQKKIKKRIFFIIAAPHFSLMHPYEGYSFLTDETFQREVYEDKDFEKFDFIKQFPKIILDNGNIVYYFPKNNSEQIKKIKIEDISFLGIGSNGYFIRDLKNKSIVIKDYELKEDKLKLKFFEWRRGNGDIYKRYP